MDGRHKRKVVNAETMLRVGVEFIVEGNWRPTAAQIAERSRLSKRTFWSLFPTLDGYWEEVIKVHNDSVRLALCSQCAVYDLTSPFLTVSQPAMKRLLSFVLLGHIKEDSDVSR